MSANQIVLSASEWNPSEIKYTAPKLNKQGGKAISIISKQKNRSLHISTPLMMTWGISDFVDEKTGESDGKYSMTLNFPNEEYSTNATRVFLQKFKDFETQILNDAVLHSEAWWGEEMPLAVVKHSFYPLLKYSKNKDTKKIDYSKPPSIRGKIPYYDGKWGLEIYNTRNELIFPCADDRLTPLEFVPKLSNVACVLQCGGIWIGGKGWGVTWKVIQCVVKPKEIVSVYGKCHIQLSPEERETIDTQQIKEDADVDEPLVAESKAGPYAKATATATATITTTLVEDSDDEHEPIILVPPVPSKRTFAEPVVEPESVPPPAPVPVPSSAVVEEVSSSVAVAPKTVKKIVKKVVAK